MKTYKKIRIYLVTTAIEIKANSKEEAELNFNNGKVFDEYDIDSELHNVSDDWEEVE